MRPLSKTQITWKWDEIAIDLIRTWEFKVRNRLVTFNALTVIDTTTHLVKITRVDKNMRPCDQEIMTMLALTLPTPSTHFHDGGGGFTGHEFKELCRAFRGLKDPQSTAKIPLLDAFCERMHQTVGNVPRVLLYSNPPKHDSSQRHHG